MDATAQNLSDPKVFRGCPEGPGRAFNGLPCSAGTSQPVPLPRGGIPAILTVEASRGDDTST